jgi:hypothetical protein
MNGFLGVGQPSSVGASNNSLRNIFNFAIPAGKASVSQGQQDLGSASGFWQGILSGNRQATQAAIAPQTNTANVQADAQRKQAGAMGTARGGGTAAGNQTQKDDTLAKIQQLLFGARTTAAGELGKTGAAGMSAGTGLLDTGSKSAASLGDNGLQQEMISAAGPVQSALGDAFGTGLGDILKNFI